MKQASYFIEVVKYRDNVVKPTPSAIPILHLKWSLAATVKFGYETIAIFKIYPKYDKS